MTRSSVSAGDQPDRFSIARLENSAMPRETTAPSTSPARRRVGIGLSGFVVLFMVFDSVIKLMRLPMVTAAQILLGIPDSLTMTIGAISMICLIVHVIPRTAVLGAILMTAYLGGATAIQVRIESSAFSIVFPGMLGLLLWAGLWLRDDRLRALVPFRDQVGARS
ncbi:MAG: DoxX family protein [Gemmatimonadota bacterium]